MEIVKRMNEESETATFAVNEFADLTADEFKLMYLGYNADAKVNHNVEVISTSYTDAPEAWDWTEKGAVTPIKN